MSVSASTFLWRSIFPFKQEIRTSASTFLLRSTFPLEQELRTAHVLRKHFWCSSTFKTKNIHIYRVCFCQHILATINIPFRTRTANRTRFKESISGLVPRLERRIYTHIMSVSASTFLLRSIFPFEQEVWTARILRKHFWRSCTFRTKNIHIYHVCFCQHIHATIDIPFRARIVSRTRSKKALLVFFPV